MKFHHVRADGLTTPAFAAIAALTVALCIGAYGLYRHNLALAPEGVVSATAPTPVPTAAPAAAPVATTVGFLDKPEAEAVVGTRIAITGWALDPAGIAGVAVHVDGVPHAATIGIARPDVAQAKPGFPDSARAGFAFEGDFADLSPQRHELAVVATNRAGVSTVLARRSLLPPAAMHMWSALLDANPELAGRHFNFLMMTSGASMGGADETDTA